jgi:hypothetical protein
MLTITPAAKLRFQAITEVDIPQGWALRLDTTPRMNHNGDDDDTPAIAMYVGEPQEDDRPVEHEGETLLYVSGCVAEAYAGFVVDVEEAPEGLRFGLGPPDARSKEEPG